MHIPTDAEWTTLSTLLGGAAAAGGKMKTTGITRWYTPNTSATNESGFTGLPGGHRASNSLPNGSSLFVGEWGTWWSATQNISNFAFYSLLHYNRGGLTRGDADMKDGFSVRCLRN